MQNGICCNSIKYTNKKSKTSILDNFIKKCYYKSRVSQMIAGTNVREESPGSIEQGAG